MRAQGLSGSGFGDANVKQWSEALEVWSCARFRLADIMIPACHPTARGRGARCLDDSQCKSGYWLLLSPATPGCGQCAPRARSNGRCWNGVPMSPKQGCQLGEVCSRGTCLGPMQDEGETCGLYAWTSDCYGDEPNGQWLGCTGPLPVRRRRVSPDRPELQIGVREPSGRRLARRRARRLTRGHGDRVRPPAGFCRRHARLLLGQCRPWHRDRRARNCIYRRSRPRKRVARGRLTRVARCAIFQLAVARGQHLQGRGPENAVLTPERMCWIEAICPLKRRHALCSLGKQGANRCADQGVDEVLRFAFGAAS
jgi:hypothetical protein